VKASVVGRVGVESFADEEEDGRGGSGCSDRGRECERERGWAPGVGPGELVEVDGGVEDGMKDTAKVPEKRTTLTASATGRTATKGLG
jgi:hypothetical protein